MAAFLQYQRLRENVISDLNVIKEVYNEERQSQVSSLESIDWQDAFNLLNGNEKQDDKQIQTSTSNNIEEAKRAVIRLGISCNEIPSVGAVRFIVRLNQSSDYSKDPIDAKSWSNAKKWFVTAIVGSTGFVVAWSSAIDLAVVSQAKQEFGVSDLVESLASSVFLISFGAGALVSGPLSETVGRQMTYLVSLFLFMIFVMASALSPNIAAQIIFRAFAGFFGSTPLTTMGGSTGDLWTIAERTYVFPTMSCISFLGPFLAPLVGSYIGFTGVLSWRWVEWITLIMAGLVYIFIALFVEETYAPFLLEVKAHILCKETGDHRFVAISQLNRISFGKRMQKSLTRPFVLFSHQIVVVFWCMYLSIIYAISFCFIASGYDYIFGKTYSFSQGSTGLMFIGLNIGLFAALAICPLLNRLYQKRLRSTPQDQLNPEERLYYAMVGAPAFPISLFWMAWTAQRNISFWSPLIATIFFGFGFQCVYISSYMYFIDVFEQFASSALVSLTLSRYLLAAAMVIVSKPMFENVGVHWTLSLLGFISIVCMPIPFLFYRYGHKIRAFNKLPQSLKL